MKVKYSTIIGTFKLTFIRLNEFLLIKATNLLTSKLYELHLTDANDIKALTNNKCKGPQDLYHLAIEGMNSASNVSMLIDQKATLTFQPKAVFIVGQSFKFELQLKEKVSEEVIQLRNQLFEMNKKQSEFENKLNCLSEKQDAIIGQLNAIYPKITSLEILNTGLQMQTAKKFEALHNQIHQSKAIGQTDCLENKLIPVASKILDLMSQMNASVNIKLAALQEQVIHSLDYEVVVPEGEEGHIENHMIDCLGDQVLDLQNQIEKIKEDTQTVSQQVRPKFDQKTYNNALFTFSTDSKTIVKATHANGQFLSAFADKALSAKGKHCFSVKVGKCSQGQGKFIVGLASSSSKALHKNFNENNSYALCATGNSLWCYVNREHQVVNNDFKLSEGDVVVVQVDYERNMVVFIVNGKNVHQAHLAVGSEQIVEYYPCVHLYHLNDSLTFL